MLKKFRFIILFFAGLALISSCSDDDSNGETMVFNSSKDKTSYVLGAMNAKSIVNSGAQEFTNLDMLELSAGFNSNLNASPTDDCLATLHLLFGKTFQDFNKKYLKEGSRCVGKMAGYAFYYDIKKLGGLEVINLNMVKKGFEDCLYKRDTIIKEMEMKEIMSKFMLGLNENNGSRMMAAAKKLKGAQVFPNGIVIQTLSEGTGPTPGLTDDVKAHYILTSSIGDTLQDSHKMKNKENKAEPIAFQLSGGVIPGWTYAIPKMKVGGKYMLFIPWEMAYGEQEGRQSLCFEIELIARGKKGELVKTEVPTNTNIQQ